MPKKEPKTEFIRARISRDLKIQAEQLLHKCGMNMTQAMNMVLTDLVENGHWPYVHREFNKKSLDSLQASQKGESLVFFDSAEEMLADLHSGLGDALKDE